MSSKISYRLDYLPAPVFPGLPLQKNHSLLVECNLIGYFFCSSAPAYPQARRQIKYWNPPNLGSQGFDPPVDFKYKNRSELAFVSDSRDARSPIDSEGDECHFAYADSYLG